MRRVALALLCLGVLSLRAADVPDPPQRLLEATAATLLAVVSAEREALRADPARLRGIVREHLVPHVDVARLSALAVGRPWRVATPAQRARFEAAFEDLLVRTYASGLLALPGLQIRYPPQRLAPEADDVVVRTEVVLSPGAPPIAADYRMHLEGGRWRVYDLVIEGVSFASSYRTSFEQEIRQAGFVGLIERLDALNREGGRSPPPAG